MKKKFRYNFYIALPAVVATLTVLIAHGIASPQLTPDLLPYAWQWSDIITLIPYIIVFVVTLWGLDVLIALWSGIITSSILGICLQSFTFLDIVHHSFYGFYIEESMVNVSILVLLLSGMSHIIAHNGGLAYLLKKFESYANTKSHAQFGILGLVTFVNCAIAINTIAIVIAGPVAQKIQEKFQLSRSQTATILDLGACLTQGVLPYSPQILLAASMAHISPLSLFPFLYYQFFLFASLVITLYIQKRTKQAH